MLLHAITDAILGALALGDIGKYFPDTSPDFKDADSSTLLKKIYNLISEKGYIIGNVDSIVAMQAPKIAPFISQMQKKISDILETDTDNISIKATTTEKLGFVGREEGIAATAIVLIAKVK